MPRRLAVSLSLVLALVLAAATITLASGGSSGSGAPASAAAAAPAAGTAVPAAAPATRPFGHPGMRGHGGRHGGAMLKLLRGLVLTSAAERLAVEPAKLKAAVKAVARQQFAEKAAAAKLTDAEKAALEGCHTAFRGARGSCDRATARAAMKKLRALPKPDLSALKGELADALGAELGLSGAKVLEAARAELGARLDQAVSMGFLAAAGKARALACFDTPASCDVKALHRQLRGHGGRHHGRHHRTARAGRTA